MKNSLLLTILSFNVLLGMKAAAQPARPKPTTEKKVVATAPSNAPVGNVIFRTNTVTITDDKGKVIATSNVVTAVVSQSFPVVDGKVVKLAETNPPLSIVNNHIALNSGVLLLNPYRLTTNGIVGDPFNRRKLDKSDGTQAKFFIDFAVNYVWAWDTDRRARFAEEFPNGEDGGRWLWAHSKARSDDTSGPGGVRWLAAPLDLQGHISYYARDSKQTTVSAIVGSGNFGGEVTLGLPIYRSLYTESGTVPTGGHLTSAQRERLYDETLSVHWFGIVGSYSAVTDSDSFDVHNRYLLGLGYRGAFKTPFEVGAGAHRREVVVGFMAGAAGVDTVRFLSEQTKEIELHHEDVVRYHIRPAFALETEVYYPLTSSLSAVMGARIYSGLTPSVWNAYFGLTIPMDKISDILK